MIALASRSTEIFTVVSVLLGFLTTATVTAS